MVRKGVELIEYLCVHIGYTFHLQQDEDAQHHEA